MISALLAVLVATVAAEPAAPQPAPAPAGSPSEALVEQFDSLCLAHPGKPEAILAAADAAGWAPAPRKFAPLPTPGVFEQKLRIRSDSTAQYRMRVGRSAIPIGDITWEAAFCDMGGWPAEFPAVRAVLQARLGGIAPYGTEDGAAWYAFVEEEDGRRRAVDPEAKGSDVLMSQGRIRLIVVSGDPDSGVTITLGQPQKVTDPVDWKENPEKVT